MLSRTSCVLFLCCLSIVGLTSGSAWSQVNVWTHRYDNARTGANLAETQLNTSTVDPNQFGKLFSYAVDADNNQGANALPLWHVNFNGPGITPVPATEVGGGSNVRTPGPIGIMGTPVIDRTTGTIYLVARTKEAVGGNVSYKQRLHALDITTGAEKFGGPAVIQGSVSGSGSDSVGGV